MRPYPIRKPDCIASLPSLISGLSMFWRMSSSWMMLGTRAEGLLRASSVATKHYNSILNIKNGADKRQKNTSCWIWYPIGYIISGQITGWILESWPNIWQHTGLRSPVDRIPDAWPWISGRLDTGYPTLDILYEDKLEILFSPISKSLVCTNWKEDMRTYVSYLI